LKIDDRVKTPDGLGTIKRIDDTSFRCPQYGVIHDVYPVKYSTRFKDDILYYRFDELKPEQKGVG